MVLQSVENKDFGVLESHRLKAPSFRRKRKVFDLPFFAFYKVLASCIISFPRCSSRIYGSVPLLVVERFLYAHHCYRKYSDYLDESAEDFFNIFPSILSSISADIPSARA